MATSESKIAGAPPIINEGYNNVSEPSVGQLRRLADIAELEALSSATRSLAYHHRSATLHASADLMQRVASRLKLDASQHDRFNANHGAISPVSTPSVTIAETPTGEVSPDEPSETKSHPST